MSFGALPDAGILNLEYKVSLSLASVVAGRQDNSRGMPNLLQAVIFAWGSMMYSTHQAPAAGVATAFRRSGANRSGYGLQGQLPEVRRFAAPG